MTWGKSHVKTTFTTLVKTMMSRSHNTINTALRNQHYNIFTLFRRIAKTECKDAACCYRCSVVSLSVFNTTVSPTKTAEPIEMQCGLWAQTGKRNHVLGGTQIPSGKGAILGIVSALKCIRLCKQQTHKTA